MRTMALALFAVRFVAPATLPPGGVEGTCVWKGKTLRLSHAYLVTYGKKVYVLLSAADVAEAIRRCPRLECAVWDVVREGVVLEPEDNGDFWLRAVHPEIPGERQVSYRGFEATAREAGRLAGRLSYRLERDFELEVTFDAPLVKSFGEPESR